MKSSGDSRAAFHLSAKAASLMAGLVARKALFVSSGAADFASACAADEGPLSARAEPLRSETGSAQSRALT